MTSVTLVYPFFRRRPDRSRFRFPPLGIAYVAAALRAAGHDVRLLDCTFLRRDEALARARAHGSEVVGIYAMATMEDDCAWMATRLRHSCRLLVAGGPLPTCEPGRFLPWFDAGRDPGSVPGVVCGASAAGVGAGASPPRPPDLDALPFPARDLFPNRDYIAFGRRHYGFAVTTVMSTRGCPFRCEFCSNVVFGGSFRARSAGSVVDEMEEVLALGYDRVSFADDVFTMERRRVLRVCDEIERRGLHIPWECLGRADAFDRELAGRMRDAGCYRVFFGIESGNDTVLRLMDKGITVDQARAAVEAAHGAGLEAGAFFILCYPGETDDTVLDTLRLATALPLDYVGLTLPYPLPGTRLLARVGGRTTHAWRPQRRLLPTHQRVYEAEFSAAKMQAALLKGRAQVEIKRRLGRFGPAAARLIEAPTDRLFRRLP